MIKKIKHFMMLIIIILITISTLINVYAITQIGTGAVSGTGSFDSPINWDDNFPGVATGSVSSIKVNAYIEPTLNMQISSGLIDLGQLYSGIESTGSVNIEVGTNAINGLSITARSGSGGLTNIINDSFQINNLTVDNVSESYKFLSEINAPTDSTAPGFSQTANLNTQINNNFTNYSVYTSNKKQPSDGVNDINFTVSAITSEETYAGNYKDTITFTVTGNF